MSRGPWPRDFVWGTATSAYQIEGAWDEGGRTPSIWDTFCRRTGAIENADNGDVAIDHVHRLDEDVALIDALGVDAYRFSISWSRLFPEPDGPPSPDGLDFYRELCCRLREAGVATHATLYHWDLPQSLQNRGGWLNPDSPDWFRDYAHEAVTCLGDLVTSWSTLNEPFVSAFLGHGAGVHAPGIADGAAAYVAAHHLLIAHHLGVAAIRDAAADDVEVGIVLNLVPTWPATGGEVDLAASRVVDTIQNELFLDGVLHGIVPTSVAELHDHVGVSDRIDVEQLAAAHQDIDVLGINYYNVNRVRHEPGAPARGEWPGADEIMLVPPAGRWTAMGWGVEPEGLTWMLQRVSSLAPNLPLMVMENGVAWDETPGPDGVVQDADRIEYIRRHLEAAAEAIAAGVALRGWFVWSLFDNFEWALGYAKTFGLVHVDRDTLERTPKDSYHWYADFIANQRT